MSYRTLLLHDILFFYLFVDIVSILCEFQDAILKKMETFMTHTQIPYHIW